jgi:small membrane protein
MTLGQLLFLFLLLLMIAYIFRMRNVLADRIILIFLIFTGLIFVIFPWITIRIANFIGIGRGTDLLLYLFIFLCLYMFIYLLSELNKLTIRFTDFVRADAIRNAKDLTKDQ